MKVFAISDLHLEGGDDKPMSVFGSQWEGHFEKISADWQKKVGPEDLVLIPGDISWAMQLEHALPDLRMIAELPGRKVLLRGNHDYWWPGISRLRSALPDGMYAIQNDALQFDGFTIAGSRGWILPGPGVSAEDDRIYERELARLGLSLDQARRLGGDLLVMTHYPPVGENGIQTQVSQMIIRAGARYCVYGHLHGASGKSAFNGSLDGTEFMCVSCDQLGFALHEIPAGHSAGDTEDRKSGAFCPQKIQNQP